MKKIIITILAAFALVLGFSAPASAATVEATHVEYIMGPYVDSTNNYAVCNDGSTTGSLYVEVVRNGVVIQAFDATLDPGWCRSVTTSRTANERVWVYADSSREVYLTSGIPSRYDTYGKNKFIDIVSGQVYSKGQVR